MARLDDAYPLLKAETPWLKQRPSDYLRRHVRLATQPLEEDFGNRSALFDLLGTIDGVADMLCYSSDYPHGTMDEPLYVARRLPAAWRDKVMNANSAELFGLPVAPAPTSVVA
jgi:predicted TIM-barrel fold metal-dependent hydrolase